MPNIKTNILNSNRELSYFYNSKDIKSYLHNKFPNQQRVINRMQNRSSKDLFAIYIFNRIMKDGGRYLVLPINQLAKDLQSNYNSKHALNLYRKQYGNMQEALKSLINPFFVIDSTVVRMKPKNQVFDLFSKRYILSELKSIYQQKLLFLQKQEERIMKINSQNRCSKCGETYKTTCNKKDSCQFGFHQASF